MLMMLHVILRRDWKVSFFTSSRTFLKHIISYTEHLKCFYHLDSAEYLIQYEAVMMYISEWKIK